MFKNVFLLECIYYVFIILFVEYVNLELFYMLINEHACYLLYVRLYIYIALHYICILYDEERKVVRYFNLLNVCKNV
jgi:hypothetical protein